MMRYFARGLLVDKYLSQWITTIMIMVNIGIGMAILAGGASRFPPPSYRPLLAYTDGRVWLWGLVITLAALLMGTPFRWANIVGLWISMFWHIVWMACFTIAALHYSSAAVTPIPAYGGFAMFSAALLTARVIDKSGG